MEFDDWKGYSKPCVEKCACNTEVLVPIKNAAITTACEMSNKIEILSLFLFAILMIMLFWKQN